MSSVDVNGNTNRGNDDSSSAKMPKKARKNVPGMMVFRKNNGSLPEKAVVKAKFSMEKDVENQIFTGLLPPYVPPMSAKSPASASNAHNFFTCEDCGDKFLLESSLRQHVGRRSVKISMWRLGLTEPTVFYNRCKLLSSLRRNVGRPMGLSARISVQPLEPEMLKLGILQDTPVDQVVVKASSSNPEHKKLSGPQTISTSPVMESDVSIHKIYPSSVNKRCNNASSPKTNDAGGDVQITPISNVNKPSLKNPESSPKPDQPTSMAESIDKKSKVTEDLSEVLPIVTDKCPECYIKLPTGTNLKQHFAGARDIPSSSNVSNLKCNKCKIPLPTSCSLKAHEHLHSQPLKDRNSYACPDCGNEYVNRDLLMEHIHTDCMHAYFSECYKCQCCLTMFPTAISLEVHILKVHIKKVHKCSTCNIACYSPQALEKHRIDAHTEYEGRPVVYQLCQLCPGRLITQSYLLFHVHQHAEDPLNALLRYVCESCGVFVEQREDFVDHKEVCEATESKFTKPDSSNEEQNCKAATITSSCFQAKPVLVNSIPATTTTLVTNQQPQSNGKCSTKDGSKIMKHKRATTSTNSPGKANRPCHKCGTTMQLYKHRMLACFKCNKSLNRTPKKKKYSKNISSKILNGTSSDDSNLNPSEDNHEMNGSKIETLQCPICEEHITEDLNTVHEHFENKHKDKHLDIEWSPVKFKEDLQELTNKLTLADDKGGEGRFACNICKLRTDQEEEFRDHVMTHRPADSPAYQCMECGMCYVVKPSLEKHLMLTHKIRGVDEYLCESGQYPDKDHILEGPPLKENQCEVCYQEFESAHKFKNILCT